MRLSVLDQSGVRSGRAPAEAIRETLALAEACDGLGYHRFWVSEHHNTAGIAGSAPEVLLGAIAARTRRIRIGSAGVMLPHYAPLKVAEQFRVLEALAPGRVDLGLGRGPGADRMTVYALKPEALDNPLAMTGMDTFPEAVAAVVDWADGAGPDAASPFHGIRAQPLGSGAPRPFVVGSTEYSAGLAAHLGLPFVFAHFFTDGAGAEAALAVYREGFRPSGVLAEPEAALCVFALAAPDEAAAEALFRPFGVWRLDRDRGRTLPFPTEAEAAARPLSAAEEGRLDRLRALTLCSTAERVVEGLRALAAGHGVEEVVVFAPAFSAEVRLASYRSIAAAAGLPGG